METFENNTMGTCLRWNNHQLNLVSFFGNLYTSDSLADVTLLSSEGKKVLAHKIVLSACSPYFQLVFESNPCKHPLVILKDVKYLDLEIIVKFIYNGVANIARDQVYDIFKTANSLQIKGLADAASEELKRMGMIQNELTPSHLFTMPSSLYNSVGSINASKNHSGKENTSTTVGTQTETRSSGFDVEEPMEFFFSELSYPQQLAATINEHLPDGASASKVTVFQSVAENEIDKFMNEFLKDGVIDSNISSIFPPTTDEGLPSSSQTTHDTNKHILQDTSVLHSAATVVGSTPVNVDGEQGKFSPQIEVISTSPELGVISSKYKSQAISKKKRIAPQRAPASTPKAHPVFEQDVVVVEKIISNDEPPHCIKHINIKEIKSGWEKLGRKSITPRIANTPVCTAKKTREDVPVTKINPVPLSSHKRKATPSKSTHDTSKDKELFYVKHHSKTRASKPLQQSPIPILIDPHEDVLHCVDVSNNDNPQNSSSHKAKMQTVSVVVSPIKASDQTPVEKPNKTVSSMKRLTHAAEVTPILETSSFDLNRSLTDPGPDPEEYEFVSPRLRRLVVSAQKMRPITTQSSQIRKSYSTPRKKKHVRSLFFTTPPSLKGTPSPGSPSALKIKNAQGVSLSLPQYRKRKPETSPEYAPKSSKKRLWTDEDDGYKSEAFPDRRFSSQRIKDSMLLSATKILPDNTLKGCTTSTPPIISNVENQKDISDVSKRIRIHRNKSKDRTPKSSDIRFSSLHSPLPKIPEEVIVDVVKIPPKTIASSHDKDGNNLESGSGLSSSLPQKGVTKISITAAHVSFLSTPEDAVLEEGEIVSPRAQSPLKEESTLPPSSSPPTVAENVTLPLEVLRSPPFETNNSCKTVSSTKVDLHCHQEFLPESPELIQDKSSNENNSKDNNNRNNKKIIKKDKSKKSQLKSEQYELFGSSSSSSSSPSSDSSSSASASSTESDSEPETPKKCVKQKKLSGMTPNKRRRNFESIRKAKTPSPVTERRSSLRNYQQQKTKISDTKQEPENPRKKACIKTTPQNKPLKRTPSKLKTSITPKKITNKSSKSRNPDVVAAKTVSNLAVPLGRSSISPKSPDKKSNRRSGSGISPKSPIKRIVPKTLSLTVSPALLLSSRNNEASTTNTDLPFISSHENFQLQQPDTESISVTQNKLIPKFSSLNNIQIIPPQATPVKEIVSFNILPAPIGFPDPTPVKMSFELPELASTSNSLITPMKSNVCTISPTGLPPTPRFTGHEPDPDSNSNSNFGGFRPFYYDGGTNSQSQHTPFKLGPPPTPGRNIFDESNAQGQGGHAYFPHESHYPTDKPLDLSSPVAPHRISQQQTFTPDTSHSSIDTPTPSYVSINRRTPSIIVAKPSSQPGSVVTVAAKKSIEVQNSSNQFQVPQLTLKKTSPVNPKVQKLPVPTLAPPPSTNLESKRNIKERDPSRIPSKPIAQKEELVANNVQHPTLKGFKIPKKSNEQQSKNKSSAKLIDQPSSDENINTSRTADRNKSNTITFYSDGDLRNLSMCSTKPLVLIPGHPDPAEPKQVLKPQIKSTKPLSKGSITTAQDQSPIDKINPASSEVIHGQQSPLLQNLLRRVPKLNLQNFLEGVHKPNSNSDRRNSNSKTT